MKFLVLLALSSLCQHSLSFAPTILSFTSSSPPVLSSSLSSSSSSSSLSLSSNSYNRNEKYQIIPNNNAIDNHDDNINNNNSNSKNNNDDDNVINRRSAISTTTGIITSSILLSQLQQQPEQVNANAATTDSSSTTSTTTSTRNGPPLDVLVNKIEKGKYFGPDVMKMKNKEAQFVPNSNGAPEKHIPQINIIDSASSASAPTTPTVEISANHVMTPEHYIQFIWLRDVTLDEVVLVKALTSDEERPVLKARVPNGVTLVPCLYCNLHGLWKGEPFTVA